MDLGSHHPWQEDEYKKLQRRIENVEHLLTRNHVTNAPNRQELLRPYLHKKVGMGECV